ncbi:hypothetical protein L209DRAFT_14543 [Thermothelomyces heterothallicus CBS 203.75]
MTVLGGSICQVEGQGELALAGRRTPSRAAAMFLGFTEVLLQWLRVLIGWMYVYHRGLLWDSGIHNEMCCPNRRHCRPKRRSYIINTTPKVLMNGLEMRILVMVVKLTAKLPSRLSSRGVSIRRVTDTQWHRRILACTVCTVCTYLQCMYVQITLPAIVIAHHTW